MEERANRGGQSDPCALMFPSSAPALLFKHCGRAPGPAYRAFHVGNGYRPMFLSLADLPVRDALPGLRVWVETARLACHEKPAGLLIILRDLE